MSKIKDIKAREILDSRGNPTIEVKVFTNKGNVGVGLVPSGASTGTKEALELRDKDDRFLGKGVLKARNNVNDIIREELIGYDVNNQVLIDKKLLELDGTPNKSKLGANAILGVSLACLRVSALDEGKELYDYLGKREKKIPTPMLNIINGGLHASNNLDIQEFMIVPKLKNAKNNVRAASEIFHTLKKLLEKNGLNTGVGDEGGFAPNLKNNEEALTYIMDAIKGSGYEPGKNVFIALDVAASSFYDEKEDKYRIDKKLMDRNKLFDYYKKLVKEYPIISIEDPFYEEDYEGFKLITKELGGRVSIVGDDLFVTNKELLKKGIEEKMCNAILIKPNQIGTILETLETIVLAKQNNYITIISHRSGETIDTSIVDLAVALNIPFIKTGSITRGERVAKYNRMMEIEDNLKL